MMTLAYMFESLTERHVSPAVQYVIAQQIPSTRFTAGGELVLSPEAFVLATVIADLVLLVPLLVMGRGPSRA